MRHREPSPLAHGTIKTDMKKNLKETLSNMFRALKHRNYRYFFVGQFFSVIGTWMQSIALSWLVYRLTNSAFQLGLVSFVSQIPILFLVNFGGAVADRFNKHKIVITTQIICMILAGILAALTLTDTIAIWHIYAIAALLGITNAFDSPARQSLIVSLTGREDLINAISLNSSMVNGARVIGPSIAGAIIGWAGEGWCFLINSLSYIAVIYGLLRIKLAPFTPVKQTSGPIQQIREGCRYIFKNFPFASLMIMIALMSLMSSVQLVLMPIFAKAILHGDSKTLGYLMGFYGLGALIGALALATRKNALGVERWIAIASMSTGIFMILFSQSEIIWLSAIIMAFIGIGVVLQLSSANTLLQTMVPDTLRGRVMAFHAMMFIGMSPIGSFISGAMAQKIGPEITTAIAGACLTAGGIVFSLKLHTFSVLSRRLTEETIRQQKND